MDSDPNFAQPLTKLGESGIGVAAAPTGGKGLSLDPAGYVPVIATVRNLTFLSDIGYLNSWTDLSSGSSRARIYKDATGACHADGVLTRATTPVGASQITTLPDGLRPDVVCRFLCSCSQVPIIIAQIAIGSDGVVSMEACTGTPAPIYINLSGISFKNLAQP